MAPDPRALAAAAVAAVDPGLLLGRALPDHPFSQPVFVIAAGKASARMLDALRERASIADAVLARGSHPLPDEESVRAGEAALALAQRARTEQRELVVLLSGGASSMMAAPAAGVTLEAKRDATRRLMDSGAPIQELNAARTRLSRIKGGQLSQGVRCATFALSDVAGDDPAVIGSGPTVGPLQHPESTYVLIGNRRTAMDGVVDAVLADDSGYSTILFDEPITGDAAGAGRAFARRALGAARRIGGRAVVIASGETTVRVSGGGVGGRCQEFALGAALELAASGARAAVAAFGTDGVDGNSTAAGAIATESTLDRAREAGAVDAAEALRENNAHAFFEPLGDLIVTGPTGTNVGDIYLAIVP